jgi:hypothetical protein
MKIIKPNKKAELLQAEIVLNNACRAANISRAATKRGAELAVAYLKRKREHDGGRS